MKNDTTWEGTDNSEINKQQAASSPGTLAGSRSKNLVTCYSLPVTCKQQATRSPGKLARLQSKTSALCSLLPALLSGSRSKTPVPRSPLPVPNSSGKTPSSSIHNPSSITHNPSSISKMKLPNSHTLQVLLTRKAWITRQLEGGKRGKEIPTRPKHYLNAEHTALTRVINFTEMMLEYIPDKELLQEVLCRYETNEQLAMRNSE
jgi:hypothetical protein